jgi:sulfite exporter TauE/SafE
MTALIAAILIASLLGSLHCAGMCGAFLATVVNDAGDWRRHAQLQVSYHVGRLLSYLGVGVAAGIAGKLLNLGGTLAGIRSLAMAVAAATVIAFAVITLAQQMGAGWSLARAPAWLTRLSGPVYRYAMRCPPTARALLIGLSTTLLPCGWLYAFVITAAGTGSPTAAVATMAAFWAGTLPALVTMGAVAGSILGPLRKRLPVLTAVMLLVMAGYTLAGRARLDPIALGEAASHKTDSIPKPGTAACCEPKKTSPGIFSSSPLPVPGGRVREGVELPMRSSAESEALNP